MGNRKDIGQIILVLGIFAGHSLQAGPEHINRCHDDAGIDFTNRLLKLISIALFDNFPDIVALIAHDTPVTMGVSDLHGQHFQTIRGCGDQFMQHIGFQQRNVTVQDEHICIIGDTRQRLLHGMTGAELFGLFSPGHGKTGAGFHKPGCRRVDNHV